MNEDANSWSKLLCSSNNEPGKWIQVRSRFFSENVNTFSEKKILSQGIAVELDSFIYEAKSVDQITVTNTSYKHTSLLVKLNLNWQDNRTLGFHKK